MRNYILADNQELTNFAIQSLLKRDEQNVIYRVTDKVGLMEVLKQHEDAVVILDYTLFDIADEDQLLIISERFATASWVLISEDLTKNFLRKVIYSSHVFSVVFKDESMKSVRDAIAAASQSKRYISQRATEMILAQKQEDEEPAILTATEIEIVKAIAQGKTTKEIANERFSSVHTINTHRKNIFRKLGINTAHEAIKYALRAGWVDASEFYI
ncbi:MAG: response regulator transcription factor [Clostridia bacterium]|nr:response regulator transcription factor [Clostridia bacterium]